MCKAYEVSRRVKVGRLLLLGGAIGTLFGGCAGSDSGTTFGGAGGASQLGAILGGSTHDAAGSMPVAGGSAGSENGRSGASGGTKVEGSSARISAGASNCTSTSQSTGGGDALGGSPSTSGGATTVDGRAEVGSAVQTGGSRVTAGGASHTSNSLGQTTGGSTPTGGSASGAATSAGGVDAAGGLKAGGGRPASGGSKGTAVTAASAGTTATGGAASSCMIPSYDAANPPHSLSLSGSLGTHDPSAILADGTYYLYATGNGIGTKTSTNMTSWTGTADVYSSIPTWVSTKITAGSVTNIWAPDISYFGGQYHLYYAVSTFGSNQSCIGHAKRPSLRTGSWMDSGAVICSNVGTKDDWNAIDPNVIVDDEGTPWMALGSFWSGIKLLKLDSSGNRADTDLLAIANSSAIEAPYIIHQCGYYYLFVSFGSCCSSPWDYNIRVGRSTSVRGPYVDKAGTKMTSGGGTLIVQGNSTWTAPGHNAVLATADGTYNIYHALDANHTYPVLRVSQLALDGDGWPVSGGP
jgi:arabinan endo-1,5-alpha-L-arabinosidase